MLQEPEENFDELTRHPADCFSNLGSLQAPASSTAHITWFYAPSVMDCFPKTGRSLPASATGPTASYTTEVELRCFLRQRSYLCMRPLKCVSNSVEQYFWRLSVKSTFSAGCCSAVAKARWPYVTTRHVCMHRTFLGGRQSHLNNILMSTNNLQGWVTDLSSPMWACHDVLICISNSFYTRHIADKHYN